jgi:hypothetical protein
VNTALIAMLGVALVGLLGIVQFHLARWNKQLDRLTDEISELTDEAARIADTQ